MLRDLVLTSGPHSTRAEGLCALEAAAMIAGEPHSDAPACVCPVVAAYIRVLNDPRWSSDAARSAALMPWIKRIVGSRTTSEVKHARAAWLAQRALQFWTPLAGMSAVQAIEVAGLDAAELRSACLGLLSAPTVALVLAAARAFAAARNRARYRALAAAASATTSAALALAAAASAATASAALEVALVTFDAGAATRAADAAASAAAAAAEAAAEASCRDCVLGWAVDDLEALLAVRGVTT